MFVEIIVICAMVIMVGWDKGVKEWFAQFEQPVLRSWGRLMGRSGFIRLL